MVIRTISLVSLLSITACSSSDHVIAKVPEASGICYSQQSNTLFVANDEGRVYELSTDGKILRKKRIGKYDLEGVACDDKNNRLLFAVEGDDSILIVNPKNLTPKKEIKIRRKYDKKLILKKDKKQGLEGITIANDIIYISNQSKNKYPKSDPSVVLTVKDLNRKKTPILGLIDHGHKDVAGLAYHQGYLYMVSDKEDLLIKYDLKSHSVILTKKLPVFAQEGITFDNSNNIYFADDEGQILKYQTKELDL